MTRKAILVATIVLFSTGGTIRAQKIIGGADLQDFLSSMGTLSKSRMKRVVAAQQEEDGRIADCADGHKPCLPSGPIPALLSTQSETSIAVDSTGQNIVIGFNDFRGFSLNPVSTSGYLHSHDGGQTFTDGGQLPSPGNQILSGTKYPQVFGDPDVKYLGACNFIYSSLMTKVIGTSGLVGTLAIHRSRDCGRTWEGPFEVTPATNPGGRVDINSDALDFADKELMAVDPDTGRVMLGWSNFTDSAIEMSVTFTDDILSASPTFAPRRLLASGDGSGASVHFAGNGSPNAYFAYTVSPNALTRRISVCRSTDNAVTWSPCVATTNSFLRMDEVLGNDRVNEFPSVAVDDSNGPSKGNVYLVYSNNNTRDGGDVAFQKSTDGGLSFSPPIALNARPGNDRAQWFPAVTVDDQSGRIYVFYYDQGIDSSGDMTEVSFLSSDDGGRSWTKPAALSERPFKAGWGNDPNQPNLGDYNQAVAKFGDFFAAYAMTHPVGFAEGQPATTLPTPDVQFSRVSGASLPASVRLGTVTFTESGNDGAIDPGDLVNLVMPLANPDTNPLHAGPIRDITASLITATPGVTILQPSSTYLDILPGATVVNASSYALQLSPSFVAGTPIELELNVITGSGKAQLKYTLTTGTMLELLLLSENFESVGSTGLPAGWTSAHGAGANTVPWVTSATFCGGSRKAFHPNANDGPANGSPSRWERLFSPIVSVPNDAGDVIVEFDVCYDTEDDPSFRILAYDGLFLRATDQTPGRPLRSVLAEAFETELTTGAIKGYPKHFPRNDDPSYFDDMSAWAGDSGGQQHVRMRLPGMAGSRVQFRFEYAQDESGICSDVRPGHVCGVSIDNFVVKAARAVAPAAVGLIVRASLARDPSTNEIIAAVTVTNEGSAAAANTRLTSGILGTSATKSALDTLGTIAPGGSVTLQLRFAPDAAPAGAALLRIAGTYDGGTFSGTLRTVVP